MSKGRQLRNWQLGQKTGSLIRAASILTLSSGAALSLIYASFWASHSSQTSRGSTSSTSPTFTQELQDWQRDTAAFLIRSEPASELNPSSIVYTAIAIAGLGTGLILFIGLERANHQLQTAQENSDRNWQAYQQALQEKAQVEDYATALATQYHQLVQAKTARQIELQAAQETLQQQRDQTLEELEHVTQQYQQARAENAKVKASRQQLEDNIQQLTQQYQQAIDAKAEVDVQIQQLETEKQRWIEYVERSQTDDYKVLSQKYETLQQQFEQIKAELIKLQNDHQQTVQDNQQLQQKLSAQELHIQAQYEQFERIQEINAAASRAETETAIVLHSTERNLYDSEKRDLVLEILEQYRPNLLENSRRQHILQDILNANSSSKRRDEIAVELRHLFWDYRSMKAEIRSALSALGFELIEDGSHYKIIFQQDSRYQITFSKTSSDRRAGRNIVGEIRRRLL